MAEREFYVSVGNIVTWGPVTWMDKNFVGCAGCHLDDHQLDPACCAAVCNFPSRLFGWACSVVQYVVDTCDFFGVLLAAFNLDATVAAGL